MSTTTKPDLTWWEMLREPFPPAAIGKLPKGGVMLDYVGHAAVTDRLLKVDPTWTWEPLALSPDGLPALDRASNLWIRLTVNGVTRIGVGDGKNAKECISDAIRNAAMRFGVALDLWAKEDLRAEEPPPAPEPPKPKASTVAARKRMHALFHEAGIEGRENRLTFTVGIINRGVTTSTDMTADEVKAVSKALEQTTGDTATPPAPASAGPEPQHDQGPAESHNPAAESYTELRKTAGATTAQLERLDELIAEAMENRTGAIPDLWAQVAAYRKINLAELMVELEARPGQPLLWQPLRDSLTRLEAGDLADHLLALRRELGLPEEEIPF